MPGGPRVAEPECREALVQDFQRCEASIDALPNGLTIPGELFKYVMMINNSKLRNSAKCDRMVDDGISPDVYDQQQQRQATRLAHQMHASSSSISVSTGCVSRQWALLSSWHVHG